MTKQKLLKKYLMEQKEKGVKGLLIKPKKSKQKMTFDQLKIKIDRCKRCELSQTRTQTVFGVGNKKASLMFVGEAPGADEDAQGEPFVGRAGKLLTKIIEAMSLTRQDVFIANVLKCRPPDNRNPKPEEIKQCEPYLMQQIEFIKPKYICALGTFAAQTLLKTDVTISKLRGKFHDYQGIPLLATYHPSYLLRNPSAKKEVWEDMQKLMHKLGLKLPSNT